MLRECCETQTYRWPETRSRAMRRFGTVALVSASVPPLQSRCNRDAHRPFVLHCNDEAPAASDVTLNKGLELVGAGGIEPPTPRV